MQLTAFFVQALLKGNMHFMFLLQGLTGLIDGTVKAAAAAVAAAAMPVKPRPLQPPALATPNAPRCTM
eukprot:8996310-Karenia_brevis.AAC.1